MPDKLSHKAADNLRVGRSQTLIELADGTYNIYALPKFSFVDNVWLYVSQAYAGGANGSATIGFIGNGETADPDGFMDAAACGARVAGMKHMLSDGQPGSQGKWFNTAGGLLTITLSKGTDTTLLIATVFVRYSVLV